MLHLIFTISICTALGVVSQCLANRKARRAEFMAFPISLLLFFPYPLWAWLSWRIGDNNLLAITCIMGGPSIWMACQYFRYEWPLRNCGLSIEEKVTVLLSALGIVMLITLSFLNSLDAALGATAAYFTCCISMFSYLVKIWRVYRGDENLNGLNWSTMFLLLIFYLCMIYVGRSGNISALYAAYVFSTFACTMALAYKFTLERNP